MRYNNLTKKIYRILNYKIAAGYPRILIYPGFYDKDDFKDQYFRLLWYLNPILKHGGQVWIPMGQHIDLPEDIPEYLDQTINRFQEIAKKSFIFFDDNDIKQWKKAILKTNVSLCWNKNSPRGISQLNKFYRILLNTKINWNVDRYSNRHEGSNYLNISLSLNRNKKKDLQQSQERLSKALSEIGHQNRAYVFGTGPSLEQAFSRKFDDGLCIACNSMVKNRQLMDHLKPKIIIFCDPIFHAGCSAYAMEFRKSLQETLNRHKCYLFVPFRDYALYKANMKKDITNRIIGIPLKGISEPNLNLNKSFHVMSTRNVITLMSLPVACTIADEINILGCDGKKITDNQYFWSHHKKSQINEHMETIKKCHPAFFNIDYNDYYKEHCETLETMLLAGEALGHRFNNLTKSYIPALLKRTI